MRYATIRTGGTTRAARLDGDVLVPLDAADVAEVLARIDAGGAAPREIGGAIPVESADFAPLVPHPSKIFCVASSQPTSWRRNRTALIAKITLHV